MGKIAVSPPWPALFWESMSATRSPCWRRSA